MLRQLCKQEGQDQMAYKESDSRSTHEENNYPVRKPLLQLRRKGQDGRRKGTRSWTQEKYRKAALVPGWVWVKEHGCALQRLPLYTDSSSKTGNMGSLRLSSS